MWKSRNRFDEPMRFAQNRRFQLDLGYLHCAVAPATCSLCSYSIRCGKSARSAHAGTTSSTQWRRACSVLWQGFDGNASTKVQFLIFTLIEVIIFPIILSCLNGSWRGHLRELFLRRVVASGKAPVRQTSGCRSLLFEPYVAVGCSYPNFVRWSA